MYQNLIRKSLIAATAALSLQSINSQTPEWQKYVDQAPFKINLPRVSQKDEAQKVISIVDFGAVGDGKTLNTKAFQNAIDQASKHGNTMVMIPAGTWLLGAIELKSNITLHLSEGALMQFT